MREQSLIADERNRMERQEDGARLWREDRERTAALLDLADRTIQRMRGKGAFGQIPDPDVPARRLTW